MLEKFIDSKLIMSNPIQGFPAKIIPSEYSLHCQRWRSSIQSAQTHTGADCGSDHELLIAKFIPKLKKVGKTTRPFRYNLNPIPMIGCDK